MVAVGSLGTERDEKATADLRPHNSAAGFCAQRQARYLRPVLGAVILRYISSTVMSQLSLAGPKATTPPEANVSSAHV